MTMKWWNLRVTKQPYYWKLKWNFRVMKHNDNPPYYCMHRVYYNDDGSIANWTNDDFGVRPFGDTVNELQSELDMMAEAFKKPVLNYDTGKEVK